MRVLVELQAEKIAIRQVSYRYSSPDLGIG